MPGTNLTRDEAAGRSAMLSVRNYDIELDLAGAPTDAETFRSMTTVTFDCRTPGSDTFIDLIAPTVHEVVLNGTSLPVAEVVSEGRVALPNLAAENTLTVTADAAYMTTGEGLHRFKDPVDDETYLYSQFEIADARRVFACFDQPDLKATFTYTVRAPQSWTVYSVSPTPAPQPGDNNTATWAFAPTDRVATYVTAVIAGPYQAVTGQLTSRDGRTIALQVASRRSLFEHLDAQNIIDITTAGFEFFENLYDRPYPFAKYDQIFVPEFNAGAMENAGAVTITEHYIFRSKVPQAMVERRALTVLHELAHMWFGDLVTMQWWDDLWLNESFAEYASIRCQVAATQWTNAWTTFLSMEKAWAYRQDQLSSTHPIMANIRDLADVEVNFDGITYAKGASVLKQLVHWVGEESFDAGLRKYIATNAYGNTTLATLMGDLSQASGQDLSDWSNRWLQQAGVTTLYPQLVEAADGTITAAAITQTAPADHPVLRPHRIGVGLYEVQDGTVQRTDLIVTTIDGEHTDIPELVGRKQPALLLLNDTDLAYAKIRLDAVSLQTAIEHLSNFADPLAATLVWSAVWDMTRDAELAPQTFIDLLLTHLPSVSDPSVYRTLITQLHTATELYVSSGNQTRVAHQVADRVLELLERADAGSDAQFLLTGAFATRARTDKQLDVVAELLAGDRVLTDLAIDTDLRWTLLGSLVAGGRAGETEIAAELQRDDTATGRLHAAASRAAIPTAAAKQAAWDAVVHDGDLPNALQAATIRGFVRANDPALLAPFVEPYFAALLPVWQSRTSEMASQIVEGLYPIAQTSQALLERTQGWLDTSDAEPALARLVAEGRDSAARAIRVQQVDAAQ